MPVFKSTPLFFLFSLLLVGNHDQAIAADATENPNLNLPIQLIERVAPQYPSLALAQGIEGWVKVVFTISETGQIEDVVVADASPAGVFDAAAETAVKNFIITPKIENGVSVAQRASQTIEFELPADHEQQVKELEEQMSLKMKNGQLDPSMFAIPDDIQWLITDISSQSEIKLHKRSLQVLTLKVQSDDAGLPVAVTVLSDELGKALTGEDMEGLKQEVLFFAMKSHQYFSGYYNPIYTLQYAKNKPAGINSQMVAKSMPIPNLRINHSIQAKLTISAEGDLLDISETVVNGDPVAVHVVQDMFKLMDYSPGMKRNKFVQDVIDVTLTMTAVQKDHIQFIRSKQSALVDY